MILYDLEMHGAGIGVPLAVLFLLYGGTRAEIIFWLLLEFMQAMFTAKVIIFAFMMIMKFGIA
jgi:hypothetical protein